jgi:hypothetical protein
MYFLNFHFNFTSNYTLTRIRSIIIKSHNHKNPQSHPAIYFISKIFIIIITIFCGEILPLGDQKKKGLQLVTKDFFWGE